MADLRMSLRELQLQDVEETGREIAKGAYGVVKEVKIKDAGRHIENWKWEGLTGGLGSAAYPGRT